jgi:hypothetical protein
MSSVFTATTSNRRGSPSTAAFMALLLLAVPLLVWWAGSSNPFTPAGYVGYLTKGAVVGKSRYYAIQRPNVRGAHMAARVTNVSVTHNEDPPGTTPSQPGQRIASASTRATPGVPLFMERFTTTATASHGVEREPDAIVKVAYELPWSLRTYARDEVQRRNGLEVKDALIQSAAVLGRIRSMRTAARSSSRTSSSGTCSAPEAGRRPCRASSRRRRSCAQGHGNRIGAKGARREVQAQGIANAMEIIRGQLSAILSARERDTIRGAEADGGVAEPHGEVPHQWGRWAYAYGCGESSK